MRDSETSASQLYCAHAVSARVCGRDSICVVNDELAVCEWLDTASFNVLVSCAGFADRSARLKSWLSEFPGVFAGPVGSKRAAEILNGFIENGLFVSAERWYEAVQQCAPNRTGSIGRIAILTKDRPYELKRCLESIIASGQRYGTDIKLTVYDDANNDDARVSIREVIAGKDDGVARQILYCGQTHKSAYLQRLHTYSGVPAETLRFAFGGGQAVGPTYGGNLNAAMLGNIGTMYACVDDDTVWRISRSARFSQSLSISRAIPEDCALYPTRAEAIENVVWDDQEDLLKCHEMLLGKSIGQCIGEITKLGGRVDVSAIAPCVATSTMLHGGRVVATMTGVAGHSGSERVYWHLLHGDALARLNANDHLYRRLKNSREVVRVANNWTISDTPALMAYAMGVDGREPLAPFLPVLRNQDGVFAKVMRICDSSRYIGHIPWAILHDPSKSARCTPATDVRPRLADIVIGALQVFDSTMLSCDITENLCTVGKYLEDIACLGNGGFSRWLKSRYCDYLASWLRLCDGVAGGDASNTDGVRHEVERNIMALKEAMAGASHIWWPIDVTCPVNDPTAIEVTRALLRSYGRLLTEWGTIWDAAGQLARSGVRLSEPEQGLNNSVWI